MILGWNLSEYLAEHSRFTIDSLGLRNENFFILYNCHEEKRNGQKFNLNGRVINHNAWLEPSRFKPKPIKKKYDALYIARPSEFKNHNFAMRTHAPYSARHLDWYIDTKNPTEDELYYYKTARGFVNWSSGHGKELGLKMKDDKDE